MEKCPKAIKLLRAGGSPKPCGFEGIIPKVCCENLAAVRESLAEKSKFFISSFCKYIECAIQDD